MVDRFKRLNDGQLIFKSNFLAVREYDIERDGLVSKYAAIDRPDSVVVIPFTPSGLTLLLKQFRFPTNDFSWELPMGFVEKGENCVKAANRELSEEVGLRSPQIIQIGEYRAAPGLTSQKVSVFVAPVNDKDMQTSVPFKNAHEEILETKAISITDINNLVHKGQITDGFSLSALLLFRCWYDQTQKAVPA